MESEIGNDPNEAAEDASAGATVTGVKARSVAMWGVLDQVVSSVANFVFIIFVARNLSAEQFGSVAMAFEVYLALVFVARGVAGDTLMARFSGRDAEVVNGAVRASSGVAFSLGVFGAVACAVGAAFVHGPLQGVLWVAAVALPLLVLQDFVRQALIVQGRAKSACLNDLLWAVVQVPMLWIAATVDPTAHVLFAAWSIAGALAAVVGLIQLRTGLVQFRGIRAWLRDHRALWPYLLGDNLLFAAGSFVVAVTISAVAGLVGLAAFRAAMTVYAPLGTVGRGVASVAVALLARHRAHPHLVKSRALFLSAAMAPVAFVWGGFVAALPHGVGRMAFGESWDGAQPLVLLASFPCAAALFSVGAACGMRALDAGQIGFGARAAVSSIALVAFSLGVYWDGVRGAFVVFACTVPIQAWIWWRLLAGATRRAEGIADQSASAAAS